MKRGERRKKEDERRRRSLSLFSGIVLANIRGCNHESIAVTENVGHLRGEMPGAFAMKPFQIFSKSGPEGPPTHGVHNARGSAGGEVAAGGV